MKKYWFIIFTALLVARISLATLSYNNDLNNNLTWTDSIRAVGTLGFYERDFSPYSAANYPPLITASYYCLDKIAQNFWPGSYEARTTLNKIPTIFAETLAISLSLYISPLMFIVYLFNPGIFYNSILWGQTEGLVAALIFLALFLLVKKKRPIFASLFFVIALQSKQSAIIFLPLILYLLFKEVKLLKTALIVFASSILYSLFFIPFYGNSFLMRSFRFLIDSSQGQSHWASVNALNFWYLIGLNKVNDLNAFGFSYQVWGAIISVLLILWIIWKIKTKTDLENSLVAAGLINFAVCMFMTRIHERHLLPSLVLLIPLAIKSKRNLAAYLALSSIYFINLYLIWHEEFASFNQVALKVLSLILLICFAYLLYKFSQIKKSSGEN